MFNRLRSVAESATSYFILIVFIVSAFLSFAETRTSAAALSSFDSEIVVRIGILQKAQTADLSFKGAFSIYKSGSSEVLYAGKDEVIHIELYRVRLQQLSQMYMVSLGKFRSFEQAEYTSKIIKGISARARIVQPDNWSLWFGPFRSRSEAEAIEAELRKAGYGSTNIEEISQDIKVITAYDKKGAIIHLGNTSLVFYPTAEKFELNGRQYRGSVETALDSYGTLTIINLVKAEDYLFSVLPREMPPLANPESLKSQAVIARTYLLNNLHRHTEDLFNLCSNPDCQVYGGVPNEHANTTYAARSTRGEVLGHGSEIVNALFHSTCGGRTTAYSDAWSGGASDYLVSVVDSDEKDAGPLSSHKLLADFLEKGKGFCDSSKYFRWEKKYSNNELQTVMEKTIPEFTNKPDLKIGKVTDVKVTEYSPSGRALVLEIRTSTDKYVFEKDAIRWVLGTMKSTFFTIDKNASGYTIKGAGWGHGVGLCQIGAMKMGKDGHDYKQILMHYYPETQIKKLW